VHPNVLLPTLTGVLGLAFASMLARRFVARRQPYHLVWALGLLWYALAAGSEALGGAFGWTPGVYRLWYATGAIGVAAYLGAGVLFLHRDPPFGSLTVICVLGGSVPALATNHLLIGFLGLGAAILLTGVLSLRPSAFPYVVLAGLILASVAAATVISLAPVDTSALPTSPDQIVKGDGFDPDVRALTPPFNIAGASVLMLGAVLSALHFWRTRALPNRVASNVLIAVGALIPSIASGLTRFGVTSVFFIGELVGLACIFAGFLLVGSARFSRSSGGPRRCR
jgi:hypothetical protein